MRACSPRTGPVPVSPLAPGTRLIAPIAMLALLACFAPDASGAPDRTGSTATAIPISPPTFEHAPEGATRTPALPESNAREGGPVTNAGYTVSYLPIPSLPTEDMDLVEVLSASGVILGVWPTENRVHFIDISPPASVGVLVASPGTAGPNITGVDFVANAAGSMGAFATLGFMHLYDLAAFPPALVAVTALPGTPARRDVDPIIVAGGAYVIYATGTEIHCIAYPSGAIVWTLPLPSPIVEAVDPVVTAAEDRLIIPTEGFVTIYDISTVAAPVLLASHFLGTTLVREVDARLAVGDALCYVPSKGTLWAFDVATGGIKAAIPLGSPLIEGNDMEIDPTKTYGFLPTLAFMHQVDLAGTFIAASHPFAGFVHQRNQDAIFTDPGGGGPVHALYAVQGNVFIYDVFGLGIFAVAPTPGTLIDGVDPALTDTGPFGSIAILSTLGFTHVIDMTAGAVLSTTPTPGTLRIDVDPKPGPLLGNKVLQPVIGGIMGVEGFGATDWVVSTSSGLWVLDTATGATIKFLGSPGLLYRGGDAQPTFNLGPPEPAFSVDDPDQDFLTKCWEYKFAVNRWPYWWYYSSYADFYPNWIPFGVFGPPATVGYDLLNHVKAVIEDPPALVLLDEHTSFIQRIVLPARPIGGLIWDQDNKYCKLRLHGQLELIVDLAQIPITGVAGFSFVPYGSYARWFPIVDRMNGWEFVVLRGGKRVWVYDHIAGGLVTTVNLDARIIRRPVFDAQRKTLCMPLADRRVAFLAAWKLRFGYPNYLSYSPYLASHVVGVPEFDLYNHMALVKLYGGRVAVLNIDNADVLWDSGPLPYWPISRFQVDCYNKVAKGYFRDPGFNYYEMHLNLYPLVQGGPPILTWVPLGGIRPWGYPLFDSKDGYEFIRMGNSDIAWNNIFNPFLGGVLTPPFPMIGNVFFDRVNKYGLVRLKDPGGGGLLYWMDLYKVTSGLPGATQLIAWPVPFEDDVVFDTQGHYATIHTSDGFLAFIDMETGSLNYFTAAPAFPRMERQLYGHPFRSLVNYPFNDPVFGGAGEVTMDLTPARWDPPSPPSATGIFINPPVEATDFTPPAPVDLALVQQTPVLPGEWGGIKHFELQPGAVEPGAIVQVFNASTLDLPEMDEPTELVAEDDGSGEVTVVAGNGDLICFKAFDAVGNSAPEVCINAGPLDVDTPVARAFSFAMQGANPVRDEALFALTLPRGARTELVIHDVAGRVVRTLVSGSLEAGTHAFAWDLTDGTRRVASGVYFGRVRSGDDEATVRIAVVR